MCSASFSARIMRQKVTRIIRKEWAIINSDRPFFATFRLSLLSLAGEVAGSIVMGVS